MNNGEIPSVPIDQTIEWSNKGSRLAIRSCKYPRKERVDLSTGLKVELRNKDKMRMAAEPRLLRLNTHARQQC
jgi:hypothetical protein